MSKQTIYNTLLQSGMTKEAALGMMGNMQCESGLEPNRLQGDFNPFRTVSKSYTQRVMSFELSRDGFAKDSRGYGLCQWTYYSRKYALYDFWKQSGKSLDDPVMQCQFAVAELKENYRSLWEELLYSTELYTCTKLICEQYERPAHNNIDARFRAAKQLEAELTAEPAPEPEPEPVKETYWPPRMICKGMTGDDVAVLQALLSAHGYEMQGFDGVFDYVTKDQLIKFQQNNVDVYGNKLDADGIAGPKTWGSLLNAKF